MWSQLASIALSFSLLSLAAAQRGVDQVNHEQQALSGRVDYAACGRSVCATDGYCYRLFQNICCLEAYNVRVIFAGQRALVEADMRHCLPQPTWHDDNIPYGARPLASSYVNAYDSPYSFDSPDQETSYSKSYNPYLYYNAQGINAPPNRFYYEDISEYITQRPPKSSTQYTKRARCKTTPSTTTASTTMASTIAASSTMVSTTTASTIAASSTMASTTTPSTTTPSTTTASTTTTSTTTPSTTTTASTTTASTTPSTTTTLSTSSASTTPSTTTTASTTSSTTTIASTTPSTTTPSTISTTQSTSTSEVTTPNTTSTSNSVSTAAGAVSISPSTAQSTESTSSTTEATIPESTMISTTIEPQSTTSDPTERTENTTATSIISSTLQSSTTAATTPSTAAPTTVSIDLDANTLVSLVFTMPNGRVFRLSLASQITDPTTGNKTCAEETQLELRYRGISEPLKFTGCLYNNSTRNATSYTTTTTRKPTPKRYNSPYSSVDYRPLGYLYSFTYGSNVAPGYRSGLGRGPSYGADSGPRYVPNYGQFPYRVHASASASAFVPYY